MAPGAASAAPGPTSSVARGGLLVVAICFLMVIFDGYDLIVYGAIVPSLLDEPAWGLTPGQAGLIGSATLVGMLIGALAAGVLTDVAGRRKIIIASVTWFSAAMLLCAVAPSPAVLGGFRFLAGLGLGGVIPSAVALTVEFAPPHRRQLYNAVMFAGYSFGGILSAVLALVLIPVYGWRVMLAIGAAPLVVVLPLAVAFLPESIGFLLARGRREQAERLARRYGRDLAAETEDAVAAPAGRPGTRSTGVALLFRPGYARATVLFGLATFCALLLVFGLNTWLPELMRRAGYPLGSALQFLLALNVGAIVGGVVFSLAADRIGPRYVTAAAFVASAVCLLLLSQRLATAALLGAVAVAGLGSVGVQILINGYIAVHYPAASRASALGWALGVGRLGGILGPILGGLVLASGLGFRWNFYALAVAAVVGAVVILAIPPPAPHSTPDDGVPDAGAAPVGRTAVEHES